MSDPASSALDKVRRAVGGAVGAGRQVGIGLVDVVRARVPLGPRAEPGADRPAEPAPPATEDRSGIPTPKDVAPRVAKHDPAADPVIPDGAAPRKSSVPGARLPARKRAT